MSPLSDDEVRRRMEAVRDRMIKRSHRQLVEEDAAPAKPLPVPVSAAVPPAPHAEPEEDREP